MMICFAQYLNEQVDKFYTFDDLEFKEHPMVKSASIMPKAEESKHAIMKFSNGHKVSVLFGPYFYSDGAWDTFEFNGINTYEVAHIDNNGNLNEPLGYQTKEEVTKEMIRIQKLKPPKQIFSKEDPYGEEDWNND